MVFAFCEMPLHVAYIMLLCLHITLSTEEGSLPQGQLSTQTAGEPGACCPWTCESSAWDDVLIRTILSEESHATHVSDQTYGLHISRLFKLYFKRQKCLVCILIIRNDSYKQDIYRRTLEYILICSWRILSVWK